MAKAKVDFESVLMRLTRSICAAYAQDPSRPSGFVVPFVWPHAERS